MGPPDKRDRPARKPGRCTIETTARLFLIVYFMLIRDYILYYLHLIHLLVKLLLHLSFHHLPFCVPVVIDMLLAFFHMLFFPVSNYAIKLSIYVYGQALL